jgi:hypothetical protein
MKNYTILAGLLFLSFSCSSPNFNSDKEVCDTILIQTINNRFLDDSLRDAIQINSLHAQIDTLKAITYILNKSVTKHDSLINERQFKRDRATRRGLFAGELIKAFIK